jgi:hypothetical protein
MLHNIYIPVLHAHVFAACQVPATCPCPWFMDLYKQHGQGHAAWTWTYLTGEHTCYMLIIPVHVHAACLCPYCISMFMLHVHVHAARSCPCCMSQHMLRVHAHDACPCLCCIDMNIQLRHGVAWTWTCSMDVDSSMDMDLQHGPGHVP